MSRDVPLTLSVLPHRLAVCRLAPDAERPAWAEAGAFSSITRTPEELSVVCAEAHVPPGLRCERGWRALRVHGPLDFALTGILAALAVPLAEAGIPLFALSTFDTDYVLVHDDVLTRAGRALSEAGHTVLF
ncbi:ACT domain-containing protein [Rhodocaloribacter sp.]